MSAIIEPAKQFIEACDSGQGWDACKAFCNPDASFSVQAGALAGISTVEAYCEWMKGLFTPIPDGRYEVNCIAAEDSGTAVAAVCVFRGTQTGPGGPVPPTGKEISTDYAYLMDFDGDRIKHVTKIWNDSIAMQQLGWS